MCERHNRAIRHHLYVWIVRTSGLSGIWTIVAYAFTVARTAAGAHAGEASGALYACGETMGFVLKCWVRDDRVPLQPIWERLDQRCGCILPDRGQCAGGGDPHPHRLGDVVQHGAAILDRAG